jgi:hypothetical protein
LVKIIASNIKKEEESPIYKEWIFKKLEDKELLLLKNFIKKGGSIVLVGHGLENYNFLIEKDEDKTDFYKDKIEYGLIIPLSYKKELFNSLNVYPLYLNAETNFTESFIIKDFTNSKFNIIATSYNGRSSYPTMVFYKFGKGVIVLIGFIIKDENSNKWRSYLNLFKESLSAFLNKKRYKNRGDIWKYFYSKFDNISFLLEENRELESSSKKILIKEHKKTEKIYCKNRKIYYENIGVLGKIVSPPIEGIYDLGFNVSGGCNINHYSKIVTYAGKEKKIDLHFIPDLNHPTIFLYISPQEDLELTINYKIHFKMLPPYPEYYYSKLNYSISENNKKIIVHSHNNHLFFINRLSFIPSKIEIIPKDKKIPFLQVNISINLKQGNDYILQFSLIYKEDKIKKSELKKILHPLKKRSIDEALKLSDGKSLKIIRKKGEKSINYRKTVLNLLDKLFYIENRLSLINPKKVMGKEEIIDSLINLSIFGYIKEVEEILKDYKDLKRFPFLIYPSGATIFDYSEDSIKILNKIDLYLNELKGELFDIEMVPSVLRKKIDLFFEYNFRGTLFWNNQISDLGTLYFTILNPLLTKDSIVFIPIIPYFVNSFTVKNIKIEAKNFNFSFRRRGRNIMVKFKNNGNSPIRIDYYPVFMRKIEKFSIDLINSKEINFKLDRDYLLYSKEFDFKEKPELLKQDDRIKITFNKDEKENSLTYIFLELFGMNVKKIVGARINKGQNNEEKILLYNPILNKNIYIYFKQIQKEKYLFKPKKEQK